MCVFLSVPVCAHRHSICSVHLCMHMHMHSVCYYMSIGIYMLCVSVQLSYFALMFFSLGFTLRKGGAKVLKAKLQTSLAKTLALVFSRCTLLRKGAVARVMWLLVVCPNKQAVYNL